MDFFAWDILRSGDRHTRRVAGNIDAPSNPCLKHFLLAVDKRDFFAFHFSNFNNGRVGIIVHIDRIGTSAGCRCV
ncbi:hypothetical protein GCM10023063_04730 [Arthrobacter methylotrophus]